jgi:hypothetical protein
MTTRRKVLIGLAALALGIQLVPVPRENPPVVAPIGVPDDVQRVLESSCYDCHSNLTQWPWYSHVAPASWLVYRDVKKGRDEMNFSEWGDYSERRRNRKLEEIEELVTDKKMPPRTYLPLHPEARLSVADAETLIDWSRSAHSSGESPPEE